MAAQHGLLAAAPERLRRGGVVLIELFALMVHNPSPGPEQLARTTSAPATPPLLAGILRDLGRCFRNHNVMLSSLPAAVPFGSTLATGVLWGPRVMLRGAPTPRSAPS
ncbi:hypothetical protein AB0N93_36000 [Streptomyces sp. NPDC091267]|uniref:hypothetical protein n=1 Tax=unclassified Streptomyces TaxID=2593676 RepID=UPI003428B04B